MGAPGTNAVQSVKQLSREHLLMPLHSWLLESDSLDSHQACMIPEQADPTNATVGPGHLQPSLWSLWLLLHTRRRHHPLPLLEAGHAPPQLMPVPATPLQPRAAACAAIPAGGHGSSEPRATGRGGRRLRHRQGVERRAGGRFESLAATGRACAGRLPSG